MVAALVLASCGPAEEEEEESPDGKEMVRNVLGKLVEKPQYGGVYTHCIPSEPLFFDDASGHIGSAPSIHITNEELTRGDWAKGPAGTGETDWLYTIFPGPDIITGSIAEKWEVKDGTTIIFHIRQGVHWHDKPPTNGRELTADDVAFTLVRKWTTPTSYHATAYPWEQNFEELDGGPSIEATDKWTVVLKCLPGRTGLIYEMACDHTRILPRDAIEFYGDLSDWRNSIGTGAFMLVDYTTGSSMTFEKNPNYWGKDPLLPDNQLPYVDSTKWLIIADLSTRLSAIRTGQIDRLGGYTALTWEDGDSLIDTNPDLKYLKWFIGSADGIQWRVDNPELPWSDLKVRQALCMAINHEEIGETLYGGFYETLSWPIAPIKDFQDIFVPVEEQPESIRERFEYHPDKARELLTEAGYPNGFKAQVLCMSAQVDWLSIIKAQWADVGVELELDVKEPGAFTGVAYAHKYEQMVAFGKTGVLPFRFVYSKAGNTFNFAMINDPVIEEAYNEITAAYFDEPERRRLMKDVHTHMLEQAYWLPLPGYYTYHFWQPWLKGYHGEQKSHYGHHIDWVQYIWIDQDLKAEMTGE